VGPGAVGARPGGARPGGARAPVGGPARWCRPLLTGQVRPTPDRDPAAESHRRRGLSALFPARDAASTLRVYHRRGGRSGAQRLNVTRSGKQDGGGRQDSPGAPGGRPPPSRWMAMPCLIYTITPLGGGFFILAGSVAAIAALRRPGPRGQVGSARRPPNWFIAGTAVTLALGGTRSTMGASPGYAQLRAADQIW